MGDDYLKRFDWSLAARIRGLDAPGLSALLERRLAAARTGRAPLHRPCSEALALALRTGRPVGELVAELLGDGATLDELRNDAVFDLCLLGEGVRLGGGASWLDVLPGEPAGAVSSLEVLPGTEEELFLLLQPGHLDELLRTLECAQEPTLAPGRLEALARLREACARRPGQVVAWCFDP